MKCPKCGRELPYGAKYCLFCDINIENDEIPAATEPTKILPTVGKKPNKPKKPKLKSEKKRQLILFYGSIAAIVLLIIIFILALVKSCSSKKDTTPSFSFTSTSSVYSSASAESSKVSLPAYNSVDTRTSSAPVSSASSAASSETVSKITIMPAANYLSFSVSDLKKTFGAVTAREDNEGGGSILSFAGCNYKFIVNSANPADGDRVSSVIVSKGGQIIAGASVGQTYNQIFSCFNTSFQFSYDEAEEIAVATTKYNNASYFIYFEKEDKNIPSLSALIKLDS